MTSRPPPPPPPPGQPPPFVRPGLPPIPPGANVPPGLEYLLPLSSLFVKQHVELLEVFTGFETKNKYSIKNELGEKIYYAAEDSGCCVRCCCGPVRPFGMIIVDWQNIERIHLHRPLMCDSCCFPCCLQKLEVYAPPGVLVGSVEQEWSICIPKFRIKDEFGNTILKIVGPFWTCSICGRDVEFKVLSLDKQFEVGKISKKWSGFARELFTDADFFGISFPLDLDVKMKAVMLGAVFLIDYMFFEDSGNKTESLGIGATVLRIATQ